MLSAVLSLAALLLAGCSDSRTRMLIVGSSTLFPFATVVAENFGRRNPEVPAPIVEATGTGGGIKLFCSGPGSRFPDMVNASRRMHASELATCQRNGVAAVLELEVGLDGVVLVQSRAATPLSLSLADVYRALAANPDGQPQAARRWHDIRPDLPARPIRVLGPPPMSGTRESFATLYMEAGCRLAQRPENHDPKNHEPSAGVGAAADCQTLRADGAYVEAGENDNLLIQKLAADPDAIGILGYSYLEQNEDRVESVAIDGIAPSPETIADGRYPAARPLYLYVKLAHLGSIHGMEEFLREYLAETTIGPEGYLRRRGLVAPPAAVRDGNRQRLAARQPLTEGGLS